MWLLGEGIVGEVGVDMCTLLCLKCAKTRAYCTAQGTLLSVIDSLEGRGFEGESVQSVQVLSRVRLFGPSWAAARQASLSITNSQSLLKLMSIKLVMPSNHLIPCHPPFSSRLQSFPASGSFPMSQFFASGSQSIGISASATVLPMNIQD